MAEFFYDSYALVEYVNANNKFKKYFEGRQGITTRLNLMELYYSLLKYVGKGKAEVIYDSFLPLAADVPDEVIKRAMEFRLEMKAKKANLSYIDAIGYQLALEKNARFLTGDNAFKGMNNVEFVK
jgi:hypothetical protein